jgi:hypothetical protein
LKKNSIKTYFIDILLVRTETSKEMLKMIFELKMNLKNFFQFKRETGFKTVSKSVFDKQNSLICNSIITLKF